MKIEKIKKINLALLFFLLLVLPGSIIFSQNEDVVPVDAKALTELGKNFTFMIASDLGRNGYYDQKPIAEMMGGVTSLAKPKFVAAIGDIHHFMGVRSIHDPLWQTNFEWIYKHPALMIPWYPILGNHEYEGNTMAVLDYTTISRRWEMYSRYYSKTFSVSKSADVLLVFIDTPPLIDKYRINPDRYKDAAGQSLEKQLAWIDSTLGVSKAKWKIVMGHHPVYSGTTKEENERLDLQERLKPILDKYSVDFYVAGHIHNFQHIRVPDSGIDYFVNSSASQSREVVEIDGHVFGSPETGFSLVTLNEVELIYTMLNKEGKIIYQYKRKE